MRRILAGVAVVAILLTVVGCGSEDGSDPAPGTKVTLGVIPIVDVAPVYLGRDKGFFSKRGLDLDLVQEQGGAPIVKGVADGKYQFGFSNVTSLMAAEIGGAPVKMLVGGVASTGRAGRDFSAIMVAYDSPIRSPKDLSGKKVAVNTLKNLGDTTVRQSVRKAGGDPASVEFAAMPFSAMPGALQAGTVDAVWVVEPQLSESTTLGHKILASNLVDTAPDLTVAAYFTGSAQLAKEPELVKRFTEAVRESLQYAEAHPEEVRAVVGTYTEISETVRLMMILPNWPTDINRSSLEVLSTLGQEDGIFPREPALSKILP
jgi:NitT/TauT family transport system substrate-binding protein